MSYLTNVAMKDSLELKELTASSAVSDPDIFIFIKDMDMARSCKISRGSYREQNEKMSIVITPSYDKNALDHVQVNFYSSNKTSEAIAKTTHIAYVNTFKDNDVLVISMLSKNIYRMDNEEYKCIQEFIIDHDCYVPNMILIDKDFIYENHYNNGNTCYLEIGHKHRYTYNSKLTNRQEVLEAFFQHLVKSLYPKYDPVGPGSKLKIQGTMNRMFSMSIYAIDTILNNYGKHDKTIDKYRYIVRQDSRKLIEQYILFFASKVKKVLIQYGFDIDITDHYENVMKRMISIYNALHVLNCKNTNTCLEELEKLNEILSYKIVTKDDEFELEIDIEER